MKRTILTAVFFFSLFGVSFGQSYGSHHRNGTTIGIYNGTIGGYGYGQGNQQSYGYRNVPFDGRYGMAQGHKGNPYMIMGNYFGNRDGDYFNPLSGTIGNAFAPPKAKGPITSNPFVRSSKAPTFQAVPNGDGTYRIVPVN